MNIIKITLGILLALPFVMAGGMYQYYPSGSMMYGAGYFGVVGFVLASFVFSLIFWLVYLWLVKNNGSLQRGRSR